MGAWGFNQEFDQTQVSSVQDFYQGSVKRIPVVKSPSWTSGGLVHKGRLGGAKVLGKLPVLGNPTNLDWSPY